MNHITSRTAPVHRRHLTEFQLAALQDGMLAPELTLLAEAHLDVCFVCQHRRDTVAEMRSARAVAGGGLAEVAAHSYPAQKIFRGAAHAGSALAADSGATEHTIPCQTGKTGFQADLRVRKDGEAEVVVRTEEANHLNAVVSFLIGEHRVDGVQLIDGQALEQVEMTPEEIEGFDGWLDDFRVES